MSHLQQESDAGHELPVYEHPPVYDELSASEEVSAPEELSAGEELSIFEELSVSEELPVSEDSPVTQELPLSEEAVSNPPPVWLLRLLYLGCMLAVIGVCLIIFAAIMAVLPIIMEALKNLFSETNTCNGYTTTEWYRSGYAAGYTDALASASNTKNATIESRDLIDILTIVDIPSLSTKDVISEERNTAENELHTQEQREESPALTTLEIPDIPSKDSILEEGNRTEKELQLEGLEDITTREKKEEGLPPPYARNVLRDIDASRRHVYVAATLPRTVGTDISANTADMDTGALRRQVGTVNVWSMGISVVGIYSAVLGTVEEGLRGEISFVRQSLRGWMDMLKGWTSSGSRVTLLCPLDTHYTYSYNTLLSFLLTLPAWKHSGNPVASHPFPDINITNPGAQVKIVAIPNQISPNTKTTIQSTYHVH
ncbi:hypothetical protein PENARI_c003G00995 [Penicillium arizonense]|uniref:Uncharacterized protein n=1 Tax=Penicillium arizonense TaxID=1835702 RepID=A0A1F5LRN4_PENAI|nr:hypothetical protein PENARI_c003G00995 [Penicillium arizonense]OGE55872.1 hypothetical protein PENARI_c003G00995 [Penicillium arizonense]